jgi:cell division GTPase FtsZ
MESIEDKDGKNEVEVSAEEAVESVAKSRMRCMFFGGFGTLAMQIMANMCNPKTNPFVSLVALESNATNLKRRYEVVKTGKSKKKSKTGFLSDWIALPARFQRIKLGKNGWGAGGDADAGDEMMDEETLKSLEKSLLKPEKPHSVGLFAGLGGGTCGAVKKVVELLKKLGIPCYGVFTMPSLDEGPERVEKAATMLEELRGMLPIILIENERWADKTLDDKTVWERINSTTLYRILILLRSLFQEWGDVRDLDFADVKKALAIGNWIYVGYCDAKGKGLENLDEQLFSNTSCLNPSDVEQATKVIFWFEGSWPIKDRMAVLDCVKKRMKHNKAYEFKWGIRTQGLPKGTKRVGFFSFAPEGPKPDDGQKSENTIPLELNAPAASSEAQAPVYDGGTNGFPAPPTAAQNGDGISLELNTPAEPEVTPAVGDGNVNGGTNGFHAPAAQASNNGDNHGDDTANIIPDQTTAQGENGSGDGKISFEPVIGGIKVQSRATPDLVARYTKLSTGKVFSRLEAQAVQAALREQTGKTFDVPYMPNLGGERKLGEE